MASLKVLHNKAVKIVLNRLVHSLSAQTLIDLSGSILGLDGAFNGLSIFLNASMAFWIKIIIFILGLKSVYNYRTRHDSDLRIDRFR